MTDCRFSNELNRLRKSSSDSIDNIEEFDSFKRYMHVVRNAEEDLKNLLRKVNVSGKRPLFFYVEVQGMESPIFFHTSKMQMERI